MKPVEAMAALEVWKGAPRMASAPLGGFLAFKSPITLGPEEGGPDDEADAFTPSMFMERQLEQGRPIGLVVDLTSAPDGAARLYDAAEWDDWDVEYLSLPCVPLAATSQPLSEPAPPDETCRRFNEACAAFWKQERNRRRYIAVHCLTGVNLAGFMIVRYLLQRGPLHKALQLFGAHRPPGVYSVELLEALFHGVPVALPPPQQWKPPPPPPWHPVRQRAFGKPAVPLFDAKRPAGPPAAPADAKRSKEAEAAGGEAADGLAAVGTPLGSDEAARLAAVCVVRLGLRILFSSPHARELLGRSASPSSAASLLSECTPLDRSRLDSLRASPHLVTWRTLGERCALLLEPSSAGAPAALIDARGGAWRLPQMKWPRKADGRPLGGVLLLADLVCDREAQGSAVWRLLCHDLLACDGHSLVDQPLQKRLALLESEVLAPRKAPGVDLSTEKLRVRKKDFYRLKYIPYLLKQFIPKLTHSADGLIILPADTPYPVETGNPRALEWRKGSSSGDGVVGEKELVLWAETHFK